ncbi:MAG: hypothetical protein NT067_06060 [Candidatus Diapherotrites archaeon]|nr:hypothetical protein [Candidatus Diapherotrites archaeon]
MPKRTANGKIPRRPYYPAPSAGKPAVEIELSPIFFERDRRAGVYGWKLKQAVKSTLGRDLTEAEAQALAKRAFARQAFNGAAKEELAPIYFTVEGRLVKADPEHETLERLKDRAEAWRKRKKPKAGA